MTSPKGTDWVKNFNSIFFVSSYRLVEFQQNRLSDFYLWEILKFTRPLALPFLGQFGSKTIQLQFAIVPISLPSFKEIESKLLLELNPKEIIDIHFRSIRSISLSGNVFHFHHPLNALMSLKIYMTPLVIPHRSVKFHQNPMKKSLKSCENPLCRGFWPLSSPRPTKVFIGSKIWKTLFLIVYYRLVEFQKNL